MKRHKGYIGQAGTGKTTSLIKDLETHLLGMSWNEHNALLALTFMHGSRKRLTEKLKSIKAKCKIECQTIDSFASFILQRYRVHVGIKKIITVSPDTSGPKFQEREKDVVVNISYVRIKACELLKLSHIKACIKNTYPLIVVDEFQDCEDNLLEVIKCLAEANVMLLAADAFQNLNSKSVECEATKWLEENATIVNLSLIHRTSNKAILNTAYALRENTRTTDCISIKAVPTFNLAAYWIAAAVNWNKWGLNKTTLAVLSPVNVTSSKFVTKTIDRLVKPFEKKNRYKLNPVYLNEENKAEDPVEDRLKKIVDFDITTSISVVNLLDWIKISDPVVKSTVKEAQRLFQIRGLVFMEKYEFKELMTKQSHFFKTYRQETRKNFVFTTIHGAKNREFDYVVILWPYESPSDQLSKRKLLYNGITRAKKDVMLIVQTNDGKFTKLKNDNVLSLILPT